MIDHRKAGGDYGGERDDLMPRNDPAPLRELRDWLSRSVAEAEEVLPDLLDLPLPALHLKLSVRPELRTAGMMQCLLDLAEKTLGRLRRHACELTAIAVEIVDELVLPPDEQEIARRLRGQAWKTHARALRGIGRLEDALAAISIARGAFAATRGNQWYLATVDAVEARILHGLGRDEEAQPLARRAASVLLAYGDHAEYLKAVLTEALIVRNVAGWEAMADVWLAVAEAAHEQGEESLLARLNYQLGVFELRHGSTRTAWQVLSAACAEFRRLGRTGEAIAAHRALAEAAIHLRRPNDAISERYKAYAELLAAGDLHEAAVVGTQILELLLPVGRTHEAHALAARLPAVFEQRGLRPPALQALVWLGGRASSERWSSTTPSRSGCTSTICSSARTPCSSPRPPVTCARSSAATTSNPHLRRSAPAPISMSPCSNSGSLPRLTGIRC